MRNIHILTNQTIRFRGFNDFYPLYKWKDEFKKKGIRIKVFGHHFSKGLASCDVLIIDYRYYQAIAKGKYKIPGGFTSNDQEFILDVIQDARKHAGQIVLFDASDAGGSATLNITPYVDIHLKKQKLRDTSYYTEKKAYNMMIWLPEDSGLRDTRMEDFTPVTEQHLKKIKLAWNIGLADYRKFPFHSYIPIGTNHLFNSVYSHPKMSDYETERPYLLSYRGTSNRHPSYDYQRNLAVEQLQALNRKDVVNGPKIKLPAYLKEQKLSKASLSPFGWGEYCYRDFESIINGALLLKPSVEHLETFPAILEADKTYVPLNWDFSDLGSVLTEVANNFRDFTPMIKEGQNRFVHYQHSFMEFYKHLMASIDI